MLSRQFVMYVLLSFQIPGKTAVGAAKATLLYLQASEGRLTGRRLSSCHHFYVIIIMLSVSCRLYCVIIIMSSSLLSSLCIECYFHK